MGVRDYLIGAQGLPNRQGGTYNIPQGHAPEVMKLAGQMNRQRAQAGLEPAGGAPSPGVIQRIFDVIQRPLYTTANTIDYGVRGKNPLEGAWKGFSGQDKTTYDKVLEDIGMEGGWQRTLAGFAGDIAGDPTTYVGAGVVKNVAEGAAKKVALETVMEGTKTAMSERTVERAAREIFRESETAAKAASEGSTITEKITKSQSRRLASERVGNKIFDEYGKVLDSELAKGRGKVVMKFLGKPTNVGSEALYSVGSKAGEIAGKNKYLAGISKAFRPTATYTQGTNDYLREAIGWSLFDGDQSLDILRHTFGDSKGHIPGGALDDLWGGLSEGHRNDIAHAIENGTDLSSIPVEATGKSLQQYKERAMKLMEQQFGFETNMGIRKLEEQMPNYVPHIYQGGTPEEKALFAKGRQNNFKMFKEKVAEAKAKGLPEPVWDNSKWTLEAAKDAGLKPVEDILQMSGQRTIESFRKQGNFRFFNAIAKEFGIDVSEGIGGGVGKYGVKEFAKKAGLKEISHPFFTANEGPGKYLFDEEIANVLTGFLKHASDTSTAPELLQMFDKVQNLWKINMTAVNPGHHVRNFMGDVFLNYEDGVINPMRYDQSMRVLKNWRENPASTVIRIGELDVQADELMRKFSRFGGKAGFFRQEYAQTAKGLSGLNPSHVLEKIREGAEWREDWTRLAHFIDVLKKEGKEVKTLDDLDKIARNAGRRVRKFNIDYGDLTPFEQKVMKRAVPFYTWMRKNLPLQIEMLAMDPGKVSVVPKGLRALQNITGESLTDEQVFGLNTVPKWLREMAGVRIFGEGMGRNQIYWNPSVFPVMDIGQYTEGGVEGLSRQLLGSTTPLARIPIEQATGRTIGTGAPISQGGVEYGAKQILPPSLQAGWAFAHGKGEPTDVAKLLGISAYNVGPQQRLGELRRQQDIVQALLKDKKQRKPRSWEDNG